MVQVHGLDQVHGALLDVEILPQLGRLGAGQVGEEVHRPALEAHEDAVGVFDDLEGDFIQVGGLAPVVLKALQDDGVLGGSGDKPEGPRAHGGGVLLAVVPGQNGQGQAG